MGAARSPRFCLGTKQQPEKACGSGWGRPDHKGSAWSSTASTESLRLQMGTTTPPRFCLGAAQAPQKACGSECGRPGPQGSISEQHSLHRKPVGPTGDSQTSQVLPGNNTDSTESMSFRMDTTKPPRFCLGTTQLPQKACGSEWGRPDPKVLSRINTAATRVSKRLPMWTARPPRFCLGAARPPPKACDSEWGQPRPQGSV